MHRDVKPENIILEGGKPGGRVFLVDFGGVQQGDKDVVDSEVVDTGTLVGTYGYMAPEQLRGSARPASDLFALGGTLLYLLSGLSATYLLFHLFHIWTLDTDLLSSSFMCIRCPCHSPNWAAYQLPSTASSDCEPLIRL